MIILSLAGRWVFPLIRVPVRCLLTVPGSVIVECFPQPAVWVRDFHINQEETLSKRSDDFNNMGLFIDFDNIAISIRETKFGRVKIRLILERLLEKGNIIIKKSYADWTGFKEYKDELHECGIELIEIPKSYMTGKNSADIRLVVDAIDLCYTKEHIDTFVIVSGDSDFSPLVSKLRENNKNVIGIGIKHASSRLLIDNCDEFIFYDDLEKVVPDTPELENLPKNKAKIFRFLVTTLQALLREKDILYSSMVKQTMKRKIPSFDESQYGYSSFSDFLEDARDNGLIELERNQRASGTYVVTGFGSRATTEGRARKETREVRESTGGRGRTPRR